MIASFRIMSIRRKLIVMAVLTTLVALFAMAVAVTAYDLKTFRETSINDLSTQAEILARVSAPAIEFNDPKTAEENLAQLKARPHVKSGAIYTRDGRLFAFYLQQGAGVQAIPATPERPGYGISGTQLTVFHPIVENQETIGTIYLLASYDLPGRFRTYVGIVAIVLAASLLLATVVAARLQTSITAPILAIAGAARKVMHERDFSLRAPKTTTDEIGVLVDAFNSMLAEVGQRAEALEASNQALHSEMAIRAEAQDALVAADKRKDEFLATLAHELRNPLAPISSGLQILRMKGDDPAASAQAQEIMERQLKQLVRLVDDLLDVSRITTGKLVIRKELIDLASVVDDAVETARPLIESQRHRLTVDLPAEPVMLQADATRLAQVVANLLNNAAKYTDPGGRIALRAGLEDGLAVIRVSDNGMGIAAELLPRVFDMFIQADKTLERLHSGLGVGLALAKHLVELHGGTIEAKSAGPMQGSEFIVRLPAATGSAIAGPAESPAVDVVARRIMLADDNVDFVDTMAEILNMLGHTTRIAYDGKEALAAFRDFAPAYAFFDIGLPHVNGYDLARAVRSLPGGADCVLIAVTGWGQDKDKQLAFEAGFNHHLVKPVSLEQIQGILNA
jgi:signal transduction histidine kinase